MCDQYSIEYKEQCVIGSVQSITRFVSQHSADDFYQLFKHKLENKCITRHTQLLNLR